MYFHFLQKCIFCSTSVLFGTSTSLPCASITLALAHPWPSQVHTYKAQAWIHPMQPHSYLSRRRVLTKCKCHSSTSATIAIAGTFSPHASAISLKAPIGQVWVSFFFAIILGASIVSCNESVTIVCASSVSSNCTSIFSLPSLIYPYYFPFTALKTIG